MKIKTIIFTLCLISTSSYANSGYLCPDVSQVKAGNFQGWFPLNNLDDEPASPKEIRRFKKTVTGFSGAEWSLDYAYGYGRCNYDSEIEVSLASDTLPIYDRPTSENWVWDSIVARCRSSWIAGCKF